jgi:hypothetical protein
MALYCPLRGRNPSYLVPAMASIPPISWGRDAGSVKRQNSSSTDFSVQDGELALCEAAGPEPVDGVGADGGEGNQVQGRNRKSQNTKAKSQRKPEIRNSKSEACLCKATGMAPIPWSVGTGRETHATTSACHNIPLSSPWSAERRRAMAGAPCRYHEAVCSSCRILTNSATADGLPSVFRLKPGLQQPHCMMGLSHRQWQCAQ